MKSTRNSLMMSALALLLCSSMLIGTTFAWFTDSVTSSNNIIKSGTLDVTMEWLGADADPKTSTAWKDASTGAIFNSSLWEPGYTEVRHIKIENEGTLALKYVLNIIPYDENGVKITDVTTLDNLADVIDVYYLDPAEKIERDDLDGKTPMGTLRQALAGLSATANGNLKSGDKHVITLALKMREEAGNEYQNKMIGTDFSIQLFATQLDSELDSFDKYYDEDSDYPEASTASAPIVENEDIEITVKDIDDFMKSATAVVPSEADKEEGATSISFVITPLDSAPEGITVESNQGFNAYDVEVIGLHESNDRPVKVTLKLESGLTGVKLYHHDDEITCSYDAVTGILIFNATSFSPYTVVYDAGWDGTADTTWYNETDTTFILDKPEQLAGLAKLVDGGNTFEGKTIMLNKSIDLYSEDENGNRVCFDPIGDASNADFSGVFDGNGKTIFNLYQDCNSKHLGLFGAVYEGIVKNLTLDGARVENDGSGYASGIAAYTGASTFENITLKNSTVVNYNHNTGGIVGWCSNNGTTTTFDGINIESSTTIGSWWGSYDTRVGGIVGAMNTGNYVVIKNSNVACKLDVYNDACSNYQWYNYRTAGMVIADVRDNRTVDGRTEANPVRVTCENVTVTFGDWANYHYCESESYGKPSYAEEGEWKFQRVEAGLGYGGVDISACNHDADETHNKLITFDFLFGARDGKGIYGINAFDGVRVVWETNN